MRRILFSLYGLAVLAFVAGSATYILQTHAEYERVAEENVRTAQELAAAKARLEEQRVSLQRMREDPGYVEQVIRARLHYAKPGEDVYRFENP